MSKWICHIKSLLLLLFYKALKATNNFVIISYPSKLILQYKNSTFCYAKVLSLSELELIKSRQKKV
jgi:hypothetical protein